MPKIKAIREVMLHDFVGPKKKPVAVIVTYRVIKGKKTEYKTLTLTDVATCTFYEWQSEMQAVTEHKRAVAHYRGAS